MEKSNNDEHKFWFGFFIGGLLGAIVLFFIGTKEGKKLGRDIKNKSLDFGDQLSEDLEQRLKVLKDKGRELAKEGENLQEQIIEKVNDTNGQISQDIAQKIDQTLTHIEAIQERGRQATAEIRKKLFKNTPKKS